MFWRIVVILLGGSLSLSCGLLSEKHAHPLTCSFSRTFCGWSANTSLIAITSRSGIQESATSYLQPEGSHFAFARSGQRKTGDSVMETVLSSRSLSQSQETQISFRYIVHAARNTSVGFMRLVTVTSLGQTNILWSLNASQYGSPNTWLPARARLCELSEFHLEFQLSFDGSRLASDEMIGIGLANVIVNAEDTALRRQQGRVLNCSNVVPVSSSVTCGPTAVNSTSLFCGWSIRGISYLPHPRMTPYRSEQDGGEMSGFAYLSVDGSDLDFGSLRAGVTIVSPAIRPAMERGVFSFWYKCVNCSRAIVDVLVSEDVMQTKTTLVTLKGWAGDLQQTWTPLALAYDRRTVNLGIGSVSFVFDVDFGGSLATGFMLDRVWYSAESGFVDVTGTVTDWNAHTSPGFQITATSQLIGAISTSVNLTSSPYRVSLAVNEKYTLVFSATQYHDVIVYTDTLLVPPYGSAFVLEPFSFIPINQTGDVTVHGVIVNAASGSFTWTISIRLNFRQGINARTQPIFQTVVMMRGSDEIFVDLPIGHYTVEIAAEGFVTTFMTVTAVNGSNCTEFTCVLSPVLSKDVTRVILTWTEWKTVRLGAHMTGPDVDGGRFEVSTSNKSEPGSRIGTYMNIDSQTLHGVEVITVERLKPGLFYSVCENTTVADGTVYVLAHSGAKVQVIFGDAVIRTVYLSFGEGNLWSVFATDGNGSVYLTNEIGYDQWSVLSTVSSSAASTADAGSDECLDSASGTSSSVSTSTVLAGSERSPYSVSAKSVRGRATDVIVGVSVSAAIVILIVGGAAWFCYRRKKQRLLGMRRITHSTNQSGMPLSDRDRRSNHYVVYN